MNIRRSLWAGALMLAALLLALALSGTTAAQSTLTPEEELGKAIFFDVNLSLNHNQSCATCHAPQSGWTGPDSGINAGGSVYQGSVAGAFGNRKPPSAAYATQSPVFHVDKKGTFVGGNFWDGRATGQKLGNPAADQAQGPFLNPAEQALATPADVVARVCAGSYSALFVDVWGAGVCDPTNVNTAYDSIALSIAAYEGSPEVNAFTAKLDYTYLDLATLTKQERLGMALFKGKGKCSACHIMTGPRSLFTDYTYDNLGLPKNPENPVYGYDPDFVDPGLGGFLQSAGYEEAAYLAEWGKQKVPTLRNVGLGLPGITKAYGHNGYFKTLAGIVNFYNTRDVKPVCPGDYTEAQALAAKCWPAPEVDANVNTAELGNLGLSPAEEAAIVAFLKTLSDGYLPGAMGAAALDPDQTGVQLFVPAVQAHAAP